MATRILTHASEDSFDRIIDHMSSMMDELMSRNDFRNSRRDSWSPAMNVYEVPDRYVICIDLAGVNREEIDIQADGKVLRVSGLRSKPVLPDPPEEVSVHLMEIDSGRFHRKVPLPNDVRRDAIEAQYRNGYLWITMPRQGSSPQADGPMAD